MCGQARWEPAMGISASARSASAGARRIDRRDRVERDDSRHRASASERESREAHRRPEVMTCRPCLASGASLACSRARTPRSRSCGRRSVGTGKAAHVGRPAGYPAALVGQPAGRYGAVRGLSRCSQRGWRWQRAHSGGCGVRQNSNRNCPQSSVICVLHRVICPKNCLQLSAIVLHNPQRFVETVAMRTGKLNARKVATAKPGKYGDGGGLWLYVGPNSKSWVYRYMIRGRAREIGLGSFDNLTLEKAREKARTLREGVHQKPEDGGPVDPLHERQAAEIRQGIKELTFRQCADDYLAAHRHTWKSAKHRQQWENTLATQVHPIIGDLPIKTINRDMVVRVLQPIWHERQETARRVRMRLQTVIDYAIARKVFDGENPATLGPIKLLLGKQTDAVQHQKALRYEQIHGFVSELRQHDGIGSEPLEWLILTATRTSETLLADWSEID